jgi:aminoglycoside phosphotransferase
MSHASVYRVETSDGTLYLKTAVRHSDADLRGELSRLLWLHGRLPVPAVRYFAEAGETQLLLMDGLPGIPIYVESLRDRLPEVIRVYAAALRLFHALPAGECPFDERVNVKLATALRAINAGEVRTELFDKEHRGIDPQELYARLLATRPADEDLVVTHGDYCTPNILVDPDSLQLTGFVDLGRVGVSDRYQDLALAARSIAYNFGQEWVPPFFKAYGEPDPDKPKMSFYRLLDEFY